MVSVNKVILVGNCGRDPEVRYLPSGTPVTTVSLATTSRKKDKSGNTVEETQWHRITFFDKLAEIAGEYIKKGRLVYVEGRIKYGKYVDQQTGSEKNTVDIIATDLQLLGPREGVGAQNMEAKIESKAGSGLNNTSSKDYLSNSLENMDDDIPF